MKFHDVVVKAGPGPICRKRIQEGVHLGLRNASCKYLVGSQKYRSMNETKVCTGHGLDCRSQNRDKGMHGARVECENLAALICPRCSS